MLGLQVMGNRMGALADKVLAFFAVGRVGVVGQVHKAFMWQFLLQSPQHTQAADAAVKHTDGAMVSAHGAAGLKKGRLRGLFKQCGISLR